MLWGRTQVLGHVGLCLSHEAQLTCLLAPVRLFGPRWAPARTSAITATTTARSVYAAQLTSHAIRPDTIVSQVDWMNIEEELTGLFQGARLQTNITQKAKSVEGLAHHNQEV